MIIKGRWYWNADRTELVPEGDVTAAFLAYPDGEEVGDDEAKQLGLKAKMAKATQNKIMKETQNKGATV